MKSGGNNFSRTFQDLKLQFPGLSRSWNFKEKIQEFSSGVGTLLLLAHFLGLILAVVSNGADGDIVARSFCRIC